MRHSKCRALWACGFKSHLRHSQPGGATPYKPPKKTRRGTNPAKPVVKRLHKRLFRINEQITKLDAELGQAAAELEYHRSINEDAQRDAAVGNYIDREEAGLTSADVGRFEKTIESLNAKRDDLIAKRDRLMEGL